MILDLLNENLPWRNCKDDKDEIKLVKEKEDYTEKAYRNQAQLKFNSLVKSKNFDAYIEKTVGISK